jgi:outer membrane protein OmpA-like peptidoglycan-associated protein
MRYRNLPTRSLILAAGSLALAGCAEPPTHNAALDQARASYSQASADPAVSRYGSYPLAEANENLQIAQAAFANEEPTYKVTHYANMANTQAQIANEMAKRRLAAGEAATVAREITLGDVLFKVGKSDLNSQGQAAVSQVATYLKTNPDRTAAIDGYTDSTGSMKLNQKLSSDRANAVKTALVSDGIAPDRIITQGHGPADPVASNATAAGRQKNRRVVVDLRGPATAGMGSSQPTQ